MKERKCVSCGAPIELGATKCEYCGMVYEPDYWAGTIRYVPIHMNRRRLKAAARVDDWFPMNSESSDVVARCVHRDIVNKLAEGLAEFATYRMYHDPMSMATIVEGEVWVEEPDKRVALSPWQPTGLK